jgi:hypothetical protein
MNKLNYQSPDTETFGLGFEQSILTLSSHFDSTNYTEKFLYEEEDL